MLRNRRWNYSYYCFYDSAVDYISSILYTIHLLSKFLFSFFRPPENAEVDLTFSSLDVPQILSQCSWVHAVLDPVRDPALLSLGLTKVADYSIRWLLCGVIAWVSAVAQNCVHCVGFQFKSNRLQAGFFIWVNVETVNMYYMSMKLVSRSIAISLQQIALTYLKLIPWVF